MGKYISAKPCFVCVGQRIVIVRCEEINISGSFYRNKRECQMNLVYLALAVLE